MENLILFSTSIFLLVLNSVDGAPVFQDCRPNDVCGWELHQFSRMVCKCSVFMEIQQVCGKEPVALQSFPGTGGSGTPFELYLCMDPKMAHVLSSNTSSSHYGEAVPVPQRSINGVTPEENYTLIPRVPIDPWIKTFALLLIVVLSVLIISKLSVLCRHHQPSQHEHVREVHFLK